MMLEDPPSTAFVRRLTWRGGFWLAFVVPVGGLLTVGYEIGALRALAVWLGVSVIALLQNHIFAELAGMFPTKPGGISLYVSEIWGRYFAPIRGVLGVGYWAGWSLSLAVGALVAGNLAQSRLSSNSFCHARRAARASVWLLAWTALVRCQGFPGTGSVPTTTRRRQVRGPRC
jgi:Amino acid permease